MAKLLQALIPLLSCTALLLATANKARSQTTSFTYDFYSFTRPTGLIFEGDTHFPPNSPFLSLTKTDDWGNPLTYSSGRAIHSKPIQFWVGEFQVDFETTVKFIIDPKSGDSNPAEGFTFFIQPVGCQSGFPGGSLGIFDSEGQNPFIFAVEFDIFSNPGVDPSYRHVGIDIGSNVSKNTTDVGTALIGQEVTARINYVEATKLISVHVTAGPETFEVSYVYDLSTFLPQQVEVGISASTGDQVAVHDLKSWYFTSTLVKEGNGDAKIRQYV